MKRGLFIILLFLLSYCLYSASTIEETIANSSAYLELFPDDTQERLKLAYLYMLSNQPDSSNFHYGIAVDMDSTSVEAWIGYYWTQSALGKHDENLTQAKRALRLTNNNASILSLLGVSAFEKDKSYLSLAYYHKALSDTALITIDKFYTLKGLAGDYYWTGDYYRYRQTEKQFNQMVPDSMRVKLIPDHLYGFTSLFYGQSDNHTDFEGINHWMNYGALEFDLIVENFRKNNKWVRTDYAIKKDNRYYPVNITSQFHYIDGKYKGYYDATIYQAGLNKSLYWGQYRWDPAINYAHSFYKKFDVSQIDLGLTIQSDPGFINLYYSDIRINGIPQWHNLTYTMKDNDYHHGHLVLDVYTKLNDKFGIELFNGFGNQSFYVSPSAYIIDTDKGAVQYHQIYGYLFLKQWIISGYYKLSRKEYDWQSTGMLSIGMKY